MHEGLNLKPFTGIRLDKRDTINRLIETVIETVAEQEKITDILQWYNLWLFYNILTVSHTNDYKL